MHDSAICMLTWAWGVLERVGVVVDRPHHAPVLHPLGVVAVPCHSKQTRSASIGAQRHKWFDSDAVSLGWPFACQTLRHCERDHRSTSLLKQTPGAFPLWRWRRPQPPCPIRQATDNNFGPKYIPFEIHERGELWRCYAFLYEAVSCNRYRPDKWTGCFSSRWTYVTWQITCR
jgi:hypothetical protein